ncbi:L,D-transpeptidase family protein [Pararhizobium haloflavum]|uniref:L,D-transpeptidase family protein n=1 Tax=Pararhizobium haloflavum TaxID=2037914 RepID=UPI000C1A5A8D|nr:L,D-transpeptidase family protein [Pararhizobium haloflavum]
MTASDDRALYALALRVEPGCSTRGVLWADGLTFRAAIGRSGMTSRKREGDGATPVATMRFVEGFYRSDRVPRPLTALPMRPIRDDMGWCDAPYHGAYNRLVRLPFAASHETMRREDHLYDIVLVMDWNITQRRGAGGSAIFMHLARPGYAPTEGCVALRYRDLVRILPMLKPGTVLRTVYA